MDPTICSSFPLRLSAHIGRLALFLGPSRHVGLHWSARHGPARVPWMAILSLLDPHIGSVCDPGQFVVFTCNPSQLVVSDRDLGQFMILDPKTWLEAKQPQVEQLEAGQAEEPLAGQLEASQDEEPLAGQDDKASLDTFTLASWAINGLEVPMTRAMSKTGKLRDRTNHILSLPTKRCNICKLACEQNFKKYGLYLPGQNTEGVRSPPKDPDDTLAVKEVIQKKRPVPKQENEFARLVQPPPTSKDKGMDASSENSFDETSFKDERMKNLVKRSSGGSSSGRSHAKVAKTIGSSDVTQNGLPPPLSGKCLPSVDEQLQDLDVDTLNYLTTNTLKDVTPHAHDMAKGSTIVFKKKLESNDAKLKAKEAELVEVHADLDLTSPQLKEAAQGDEVLASQTLNASTDQPTRALASQAMDEMPSG
uniref:Uncharacterized protein n=1 Tax=Cannabis sativa TaxID=3483 RepID=A0A803QCZ9_CANSA